MGRIVSARAVGLLAIALGCGSGSKARPPVVEDAKHAARIDAAMVVVPDAAAPASSTSKTGDVQVRVEWKDVPVPARASRGKTPCNTPRAPAVAPTTTWGIPDALVIVDGAPAAPASEARVMLVDCALSPRLAAGTQLVIASAVDQPARIQLARRATLAALPAVEAGKPLELLLPIAGHAVAPTVEPGALYEIATAERDPETAWFVAGTAAVTDASGTVLVKDVPVGTHAVRAWLPPRAGQPARSAKGQVTVEPGDLAELVLQLE